MHARNPDEHMELPRQRWKLLIQLERWIEWPLALLGLIWLILLILELTRGIDPFLEHLGEIIWIIFIADFIIRFIIAPSKSVFLRRNILTMIALVLPALRVLRFLRVFRALRGMRLVRIVGTINRGMRSLSRSMGRRGLPYVIILTLIVLVVGAAGMFAFENTKGGPGLHSYPEALWWTAMLMTTIGSEYWPQTSEGRALTLLLSLYALGILGYVAASLATFFIGREEERSTTTPNRSAETQH